MTTQNFNSKKIKSKKIALLLGVTMAFILVAGGCKANTTKTTTDNGTTKTQAVESTTKDNTAKDDASKDDTTKTDATKDTATSADTEATTDTADLVADNVAPETTAKTDIPMVKLPKGITGMKAEAEPNNELKKIIIDTMEIPDDFLDSTQYYYNHVDLNNDGTDEIFVMVKGLYTSGSGGSSALILTEKAGKLHVMQSFTLVNTPVIVSDEVVNGYHKLIVPYYGGDKSEYSVLSYKDGEYTNVPDGKIIDKLDGVKGKAIIANDLIEEATNGIPGLNLSSK